MPVNNADANEVKVRAEINQFLKNNGLKNTEGENVFYRENGEKIEKISEFIRMNPREAFLVFNPEYPDNLTALQYSRNGGFKEKTVDADLSAAVQAIMDRAEADRKLRTELITFMDQKAGQKGSSYYSEDGEVLNRESLFTCIEKKQTVFAFHPAVPDSLSAFRFDDGKVTETAIDDKVQIPEDVRRIVSKSRHENAPVPDEKLLSDSQLTAQRVDQIMNAKMAEAEKTDMDDAGKKLFEDLCEEQYKLCLILQNPKARDYEQNLNEALAVLGARAAVCHTISSMTDSSKGKLLGAEDMAAALRSPENLKKLKKAMKTPEMLAALKKQLPLGNIEKMAQLSAEKIYDLTSLAAGEAVTAKKKEKEEEIRKQQEEDRKQEEKKAEAREKRAETENYKQFDESIKKTLSVLDFPAYGIQDIKKFLAETKLPEVTGGHLTLDRRCLQTMAAALMMQEGCPFEFCAADGAENKAAQELRKKYMQKVVKVILSKDQTALHNALIVGSQKLIAFLDEKLKNQPEITVSSLLKPENRELMLALFWAKDFNQELDNSRHNSDPDRLLIPSEAEEKLQNQLELLSAVGSKVISERVSKSGVITPETIRQDPAAMAGRMLAGHLVKVYLAVKQQLPQNKDKKISEIIGPEDTVANYMISAEQSKIAQLLTPMLKDPEVKEGIIRGLEDDTLQKDFKAEPVKITENGMVEFRYDLTKLKEMAKIRGHLALEKQKAEEKQQGVPQVPGIG